MATKSERQSLTVPRLAEHMALWRAAGNGARRPDRDLDRRGSSSLPPARSASITNCSLPVPGATASSGCGRNGAASRLSSMPAGRLAGRLPSCPVFCALAALLFWKAPRQPMAFLAAITMVLLGGAVYPARAPGAGGERFLAFAFPQRSPLRPARLRSLPSSFSFQMAASFLHWLRLLAGNLDRAECRLSVSSLANVTLGSPEVSGFLDGAGLLARRRRSAVRALSAGRPTRSSASS